ncbi:MAG: hypothetical protein ACI9JN_001473 [Bacteroidia bacterium]|jgi:hypothetical protein
MANLLGKYRRWKIKKDSSSIVVERTFTQMRKASRLAVLYRADDEDKDKLLKKLGDFCEANHLKLVSFGYFDNKELQTHVIPHSNADFFCNKHLDALKIPHKSEFLRFASEKFDYLLNLYPSPCLPLLGISALSEAKFRVGPHWESYDFCFDLMLQASNNDLMQFTDEVLIYLKNFGNGKV